MILKNSKEGLQCKIKEIFQNLTGKMRKKNWYNYLINISGKESNNKEMVYKRKRCQNWISQ